MNSEPTEHDLALWDEYLTAMRRYHQAINNLFGACYWPDRKMVLVEILRRELHHYEKRFEVIEVVGWMEVEDQQMLIQELLPFAALLETKRSTNHAQEIILSWPHQWLDENLEKHMRAVIQDVAAGEYKFTDLAEFYSGLIGIFRQVNPDKAKGLAEEAAAHSDPEVRSIGESWLTDAKWPS